MDTERVIQRVSQKIDLKNLVFLIRYGNKNGKDIDLLTVIKDGIEMCPYEISEWDIIEINEKEFVKKMLLLDPVITEPIITGTLLFGSEEYFGQLKRNLLSLSPSIETIKFLHQRSREELKSAYAFLQLYRQRGGCYFLLCTLINLSFACSYYEFAMYYQGNNSRVITLTNLLSLISNPLLKEVIDTLKKAKSGENVPKIRVSSLFHRAQEALRGD